jgi:hypothetical protein
VIDAEGVQNVAKFHEMVHVERHRALLKHGSRLPLSETGPFSKIVCYRSFDHGRDSSYFASDEYFREIWAEEAGRAAAVSYFHLYRLYRSDAFQSFLSLCKRGGKRTNAERWRLLALSAKQIGVNRTALNRQLNLEGLIEIRKVSNSTVVYPTPNLPSLLSLMGR